MMRTWIAACLLCVACSDEAGPNAPSESLGGAGGARSPSSSGGSGGSSGSSSAPPTESGKELKVEVPDSGSAYIQLATPKVVEVSGDPKQSNDWDLAFEGYAVFTNGGVSGAAKGAGFGPLDASEFESDSAPQVPFLTTDTTGGAFLEWYAYDETTHQIWSRYHVFGVRDGERLWKVQILSYYGQRDGAAVSALYQIRYAELTDGADSQIHELSDVDGTAGGLSGPGTTPSGCLDLASGERLMIAPEDALTSKAWHLCFRRDTISVNGGIAGPRGVTAVDLESAASENEELSDLKTKTPGSEKSAFADVAGSQFDGQDFIGDHVVSAFADDWYDASKTPPEPASAAWVARDAAGETTYLVEFTEFQDASKTGPGTVVLRIKPVKKSEKQ